MCPAEYAKRQNFNGLTDVELRCFRYLEAPSENRVVIYKNEKTEMP